MRTGTKIITLDNGYHLWTNTQGEGDIHPSAFTLKYFSAIFHLLRSQKLWFSR